MLKNPSPRQHTLEMVILEDLVPADHLLRKIDVAYRWFLGLSLTDKIIDAPTFSQQRRRRF